jgi:hypothetical protein
MKSSKKNQNSLSVSTAQPRGREEHWAVRQIHQLRAEAVSRWRAVDPQGYAQELANSKDQNRRCKPAN